LDKYQEALSLISITFKEQLWASLK
jgi:hypothetical protein